ncbi:TetR family transcriptional regulator [Klebsiella pneumoniae]|nr:TetR family transcriptional regulator [Klebsiella pneumoniae]
MARPKSEDKKQALLEAATAAFAQSGIAASTSAIARSAGVAEGTLFRYFATKDELLNELYLAIKLRLVRTMIAGLDPDEKRPKENARNIWNSYIDWGVATRWSTKRSAGWRSASASPTKPAAR